MAEDFDHEWDIKGSDGMNVTERKLYKALKKMGLHPKAQYPISEMTVDFAFPEHKIAIEVNGPYHDDPEVKLQDKRRWFVLNSLGWKRKTYKASSVYRDPDSVAYRIEKLLPVVSHENDKAPTTTRTKPDYTDLRYSNSNPSEKDEVPFSVIAFIVVCIFLVWCIVTYTFFATITILCLFTLIAAAMKLHKDKTKG